MTTWHIKEISELTQTSIRMLRHYDKIGLLKPSYREANGYRCYTEPDLAKLQQIIALRYFGFSLGRVKDILQKHTNIYAHLQAQQHVLKKQEEHVLQVNHVLKEVLSRLSPSASPDTNDLLSIIEVFKMTENLRDKLKKSWAGTALTESQFEDYLYLYEQFPEEFAKRDALIEEINQQNVGDPEGEDGERIATFMQHLANKMRRFFTEQIKLSSSIMESIQSGQLTQLELTPEGIHWLSRAMLATALKRWNNLYNQIVDNISSPPEGELGKQLAREWRELIDNFLASGNKDYLIGILLWQNIAHQSHEVSQLKAQSSLQEMLKPWSIKLLYNPDASAWISKALETHA